MGTSLRSGPGKSNRSASSEPLLLTTYASRFGRGVPFGTITRERFGTCDRRHKEAMARILIVDDEPKLGRVLVEMLEGAGHDVTHAGGGAEAIKRVTAGDLDVVVTDLLMPNVDGMTVLREVRRLSPTTDVVLMTAHATAQNAVDAMKQGAADYL